MLLAVMSSFVILLSFCSLSTYKIMNKGIDLQTDLAHHNLFTIALKNFGSKSFEKEKNSGSKSVEKEKGISFFFVDCKDGTSCYFVTLML